MRRAGLVLSAFVVLACGTEPPPPTATPEPEAPAPAPAQAVDVAESAPSGGTALHKDIVAAARSAKGVSQLKLRTDGSGAVVKQSLYHTDASKVPASVKALAKKELPGKTVRYENEVYADVGVVFEVEVRGKDGTKCEVAAGEDGTLRYKECEAKPKDLPVEVTRKLGELYPKGKILEAETKQGPGIDEVTIELADAGKEYYIRMTPDGTVVQTLLRVPAIVEIPIE